MFFSFLYKYEVSYFRIITKNPNITISSISSVPMFFMLISALAALILLKFQQLCGYRNIFLMSLFISVLNNFLISYTHNFQLFVFLKSLGGINTAITFVLPLYCVWRYFKEASKPVIGGFLGSFQLFASIITAQVSYFVINPQNIKPSIKHLNELYFDSDVALKVPRFYRIIALQSLICGLIGILLITEPYDSDPPQGDNQQL
jgi:hypothetical protein